MPKARDKKGRFVRELKEKHTRKYISDTEWQIIEEKRKRLE